MRSAPLELLVRGEFLCPACGARQVWSDACRRCRCDLTLFHRTASAWLAQRDRCLQHLVAGESAEALDAAEMCNALAPSHEVAQLLAVCRLMHRDFLAALAAQRLASDLQDEAARGVFN